MAYYCPECGEELVLEDDGDYYCDNCMCYHSISPGQERFYEDPDGYLEYRDDEKKESDLPGPGCRACGNPNYPKCIDSCPLTDD